MAECKGELGLDHYVVQSWHYHLTLIFLIPHFLVRLRRRLGKEIGSPDVGAVVFAHATA